jgi:hypothetical protein
MAGPQFVGPTGAQYGAQNLDTLQKGIDSIANMGKFIEAKRQFDEQEKRLNRTLNASAQQKIFDNLLAATDSQSAQEVADKFGPALSSMFQTWGLGTQDADGLVETLKNTSLSGPQFQLFMQSVLTKYGEGGTSADVLREAQKQVSGFTTPAAETTTVTSGASMPASTPGAAPAIVPPTRVPVFKPVAQVQQASGQTDPVERLKSIIASKEQTALAVPGTAAGTAGRYVTDPDVQTFLKTLDPADTMKASTWLSDPNGMQKFVQTEAPKYTAPTGTIKEAVAAKGGPGAQAWMSGPPSAEAQTALRQALLTPVTRGSAAPVVQADVGQRAATPTGVEGATKPAEQRANDTVSSLQDVVAKILAGDTSMQTSVQAKRVYTAIKSNFTYGELAKGVEDPETRQKYIDYWRGFTQDPENIMAALYAVNPEAAASYQSAVAAANDPTAKMEAMAKYAEAAAKLMEAGYAPQKLAYEMRKLAADATKDEADAQKAINDLSAVALIPPANVTAMTGILTEMSNLQDKIGKTTDQTAKVEYQKTYVKLGDLYNSGLTNLSTVIKSKTGVAPAFPPLEIDTKTFQLNKDNWLVNIFRPARSVTVSGTAGVGPTVKPLVDKGAAPVVDVNKQGLTQDFELQ